MDQPCAKLGGCCGLSGGCRQTLKSECKKKGGTFNSELSCSEGACRDPQPCCTRTGCEMKHPTFCKRHGGRVVKGKSCSTVDCPTFACCDGESCTMRAYHKCRWIGGKPFWGKDCSSNPCSQPTACCGRTSCSIEKAGKCDGIVEFGKSCSSDPCSSKRICCCPRRGSRPLTPAHERWCRRFSQTYGGEPPCSDRAVCDRGFGRGACCFEGECRDDVPAGRCVKLGGRPHRTKSCSQVTCGKKTACCNSGNCTMKTASACRSSGGTPKTKRACWTDPC
ncbi:MAG: hypothetical protein ABEL76_13655 [Bradymonadaceae bacterium]